MSPRVKRITSRVRPSKAAPRGFNYGLRNGWTAFVVFDSVRQHLAMIFELGDERGMTVTKS